MAKFNDELTGISPINVIPEGCIDFTESAKYVINSIEEDLVNLFESVNDEAVDESTEAVNEAEVKAENKFVEFFKSLWARIKKFFENLVGWFKEQGKKAKQAMDDVIDKINQKIADAKEKQRIKFTGKLDPVVEFIPKDAKLGKIHTFPGVGDSAYLKEVDSIVSKLQHSQGDELTGTINALPKMIAGESATTVAEMKKKLRETYTGDEIAVTGENFPTLYANNRMAFIVFQEGTNKQIKKAYNKERKTIQDAINEVKKQKKEFSDPHKEVFAPRINALTKAIQTAHAAVGVECSVAQQRFREYLFVLLAAWRSGASAKAKKEREAKKEAKKAAKNEAADIFVW